MKYFVLEIQNGSSYLVTVAEDENPDVARQKGESAYHSVLSYAALSNLPMHAAILVNEEGKPVMNQCYYHRA